MTDYTNLPDSLFQVGKPGIGSIFQKMRDNLESVRQGDPTAPKIQPRALGTYLGEFQASTGGGRSHVVDVDISGVGIAVIWGDADTEEGAPSGSSVALELYGSTDGGVTFDERLLPDGSNIVAAFPRDVSGYDAIRVDIVSSGSDLSANGFIRFLALSGDNF